MKSLMFLWRELLLDMSSWCRVSAPNGYGRLSDEFLERDFRYIQRRVVNEGTSFLTMTLPSLSESLQKGLDEGKIAPCSSRFKTRRGTSSPEFLQGFYELVFDRTSGELLDTPNPNAIFAIRQLTLFFNKILLPCSDERVKMAFDKYIECELDVKRKDASIPDGLLSDFDRINLLLSADMFSDIDKKIYEEPLHPKHGPGATSDRIFGNEKFRFRSWTRRLEYVFPHLEYVIPNLRHHNDDAAAVDIYEPGSETPVRVVSVPKTLKTPRIIAIEPVCMQYTQQAVSDVLVSALESSKYLHASMIGFTDQTPNQSMAREASLDQRLATLDLSEASDRVSNQLVRRMLRYWPHFGEAVDATRSRKADVPGHGVIRLAKFASMGSALTFPVEALVFLTIIFVGIEKELNRPLTRKDVLSLRGRVRVYGDDIIVPVEYTLSVVKTLEDFGLLVNMNKSFWTGRFRESCGKEYYDGHDVSITRVRRLLPTQRSDVKEFISTVSLRNDLYRRGCWRSARYLDSYIAKAKFAFPNVLDTSPVLGRTSFLGYEAEKTCSRLHRPLVKGYTVRTRQLDSRLDGVPALLKILLKRGEEPFADKKHLERHGRSEAVDIKLGWAQPF